jgi:hypothetical protein
MMDSKENNQSLDEILTFVEFIDITDLSSLEQLLRERERKKDPTR